MYKYGHSTLFKVLLRKEEGGGGIAVCPKINCHYRDRKDKKIDG